MLLGVFNSARLRPLHDSPLPNYEICLANIILFVGAMLAQSMSTKNLYLHTQQWSGLPSLKQCGGHGFCFVVGMVDQTNKTVCLTIFSLLSAKV